MEERLILGGHQDPHGGHNQEAYNAKRAALARALETASTREAVSERVTIFTDARAAIGRIASEEPGPGQMCALKARKHTAVLRRAQLDITTEIMWCPAHKGVLGNEKADEWAKLTADEPNARGVEARVMPLPISLAYLGREISENKWAGARQWVGGQTSRKKYGMPSRQKPDMAVAGGVLRDLPRGSTS